MCACEREREVGKDGRKERKGGMERERERERRTEGERWTEQERNKVRECVLHKAHQVC